MPKLDEYSDDELKEHASEAISMSDLIRRLRLNQGGGTWHKVKQRVLALGIDPRNQGRAGVKHGPTSKRTPTHEILEGKHPSYRTGHLKQRLLDENVLDYQCQVCGISDWQNQPLTLELDHIDGDRWNHRLENLRLLCPNCHSQTPTFRGRNMNKHQSKSVSSRGETGIRGALKKHFT